MERMAYPFAPEVAFLYNSGASVGQGMAVRWATAGVAVPYPEPDLSGGVKPKLPGQTARAASVTTIVPAVTLAVNPTASNGPCAVALEDVAATSWGYFGLSGLLDVRIGISQNITANQALTVSASTFIGMVTPGTAVSATSVFALALEAVTTSAICSAGLISAWIPRSWSCRDKTLGFSTS